MLTISTPASADDAASYYGREGLQAEGGFRAPIAGRGAERLGLSGVLPSEDLRSLIRNRLPSGEKLTQRDRHDKKPLTDFCFSPPKGVSVAALVGKDDRIAGQVMAATLDTCRHMERKTACRVMRFKKYRDVTTGIAVIDVEVHLLGRPVNGVPDPQVHAHAKFLNVTFESGKRFSAQMDAVVRDKALYQKMFNANLRCRMERLGYETEKRGNSWGLACVSPATERKFSRRTELIELEATRRRIRTPKGKAALGRLIREKKADAIKADKAFDEWLKRLTPDEHKRLGSATRKAMEAAQDDVQLPEALRLENTLESLLKGVSAVSEEVLLTETMARYPAEVSPEGLERAVEDGPFVRATIDQMPYVTTKEAMKREKEVVTFADSGGIRIRRTKRGEVPKSRAMEMVLSDADKLPFDELYSWVQKAKAEGFTLLLHSERNRDYRRSDRGSPLVWIEDIAHLPTGQQRPGLEKQLAGLMKLPARVMGRLKRQLERIKVAREIERSIEHGEAYGLPERQWRDTVERERGWSR